MIDFVENKFLKSAGAGFFKRFCCEGAKFNLYSVIISVILLAVVDLHAGFIGNWKWDYMQLLSPNHKLNSCSQNSLTFEHGLTRPINHR